MFDIDIDADGIIHVAVGDKATNMDQSTAITSSSCLSGTNT